MACARCKQVFADGDFCYQVRYGNWDKEEDEFVPTEEVAFYCSSCLPDIPEIEKAK